MALVKCQECSKEISTDAKVCPHCGKANVKQYGFRHVVCIVGVFIVLFLFIGGRPDNVGTGPSDGISAARGACLLMLDQVLHDPASAKMEPNSSWYVEKRKDGTVMVQPRGRAKNAFGAYILTTWECITKAEGGNIRVLSMKQISP